jgi:hypothetical protein
MMSRYTQYGASPDPLQRRSAITVAKTRQHPHSLHDGLIAIAPRLALVFLVASFVEMVTHWIGR